MQRLRSRAFVPFLLAGAFAFPAVRPAGAAEAIKASHILVSTQEEAAKIRQEIVDAGGGKAFAAAARKYSRDAGSKVLGGSLDWIGPQSGYDKAFFDAAIGLKTGDISQPVKSTFGWHLITVTDRRDRAKAAPPAAEKATPPTAGTSPTVPPTVPPPQPPPQPGPQTKASPPAAGPNELAPRPPAVTPAPGATPAPGTTPATPQATPLIQVEPKRRPLGEDSLRMMLETVKTSDLNLRQFYHEPEEAIEVNLTLKNQGSKDQTVFVRELWPLGLRVTPLGERTPLTGDFNAMAEPASFTTVLKPYESIGIELSVNDWFKKLARRRYGLNWDANLFLTNLEIRFPKVKELPDYATITAGLRKRFAIRSDTVFRDLSPRIAQQRQRDLPLSVFERLDPAKKYYVSLKMQGEAQPVIIQLHTDKQPTGSRHIANLVLEGFYDGLGFFEIAEGDFLLGGSPNYQVTGAPSQMLPTNVRNDQKIDHKRGTVSLVSRSIRQKGPITGGEVGSIFVICLKPHPEWNEEHVPVGEVISGLEALDKVQRPNVFSEITLLTESDLGNVGQPGASLAGNPQALIKTAKGNLTVELFEDLSRNTVSNFITLTESGFYNKDKSGAGKQKFFFLMKDNSGKPVLIQTGSPNNDFEGGPGYHIADEPNAKKHVKGALVMVIQQDPDTQTLVPNSAGSQFFICLTDIPAYDFQERKLTIFGQVTGGLDVLDKLQEGDVLEGIEIPKKKSHPYTVNKIPAP